MAGAAGTQATIWSLQGSSSIAPCAPDPHGRRPRNAGRPANPCLMTLLIMFLAGELALISGCTGVPAPTKSLVKGNGQEQIVWTSPVIEGDIKIRAAAVDYRGKMALLIKFENNKKEDVIVVKEPYSFSGFAEGSTETSSVGFGGGMKLSKWVSAPGCPPVSPWYRPDWVVQLAPGESYVTRLPIDFKNDVVELSELELEYKKYSGGDFPYSTLGGTLIFNHIPVTHQSRSCGTGRNNKE